MLFATRRPLATALTVACTCGGGGALARMLLAPREAQCTVAPTPPGQLVRSVSTMAEEEGRYKTTMRIIWRCLQLFFLLAPVLATLPLLRTKLRARWLRLLVSALERCGPVGIKWGQWASTRYDIFEDVSRARTALPMAKKKMLRTVRGSRRARRTCATRWAR